MNTRSRAILFTRYVGLELKGAITARGFTAKEIALRSHRSPAAFNRWLNGHVEIPLAVVCESCELIGISPGAIIDAAFERVAADERASHVSGPGDDGSMPLAAKHGRRRTDEDPAE